MLVQVDADYFPPPVELGEDGARTPPVARTARQGRVKQLAGDQDAVVVVALG